MFRRGPGLLFFGAHLIPDRSPLHEIRAFFYTSGRSTQKHSGGGIPGDPKGEGMLPFLDSVGTFLCRLSGVLRVAWVGRLDLSDAVDYLICNTCLWGPGFCGHLFMPVNLAY
jgi:hypothetical protein